MKVPAINSYNNYSNLDFGNKKDKRITESMAVAIPAILIGTGVVMLDSPNVSDSFMLKDSEVFDIDHLDTKNFLDRINIENLKIKKADKNTYEFSADKNIFESYSGKLTKSEDNPNFMYGEFSKSGLKKEGYKYTLTVDEPKNKYDDSYKMQLILHDNKNKISRYVIEKKNDNSEIYLNGKRLPNSEERNLKTISGVIFVILLAGAYNMTRK